MANTALLVIDMLNDFLLDGAPLQVPGGKDVIPCIREQIDKARQNGLPILYPCDAHAQDDPEFKIWPPHAVKGTKGAEIVDELKPASSDIYIPKTKYNSFYRTDLEQRLESLRVEKLIVTGVVTEICILYTSADAIMRGYEVEVPDGCTKSLNEEDGRFALRQIREILQS